MGHLGDCHCIIFYQIERSFKSEKVTAKFPLVHDKCICPISQPCELGLQWGFWWLSSGLHMLQ